jgi:hypothetical protein
MTGQHPRTEGARGRSEGSWPIHPGSPGKKPEGGVSSPIDLHGFGSSVDRGFSESGVPLPFAVSRQCLDVETAAAEALDIVIAGTCHFAGQLVENVEVM